MHQISYAKGVTEGRLVPGLVTLCLVPDLVRERERERERDRDRERETEANFSVLLVQNPECSMENEASRVFARKRISS